MLQSLFPNWCVWTFPPVYPYSKMRILQRPKISRNGYNWDLKTRCFLSFRERPHLHRGNQDQLHNFLDPVQRINAEPLVQKWLRSSRWWQQNMPASTGPFWTRDPVCLQTPMKPVLERGAPHHSKQGTGPPSRTYKEVSMNWIFKPQPHTHLKGIKELNWSGWKRSWNLENFSRVKHQCAVRSPPLQWPQL